MIIKILNHTTGNEIATFSFKESKKCDFREVMRKIVLMQESADILGLGALGVADLGICSWFNTKFGFSTVDKDEAILMHTGKNSCIIGGNYESPKPDNVLLNGSETSLSIDVIASYEGYVISSGKVGYSIFGTTSAMYFSKITSRNFKCTGKASARRFLSLKAMYKYVSDNRGIFEYMAKKYQYTFSAEYASTAFEASITGKKAEQEKKDFDTMQALFAEINALGDTDESDEPEFDVNAGITDEAARRMRELGLDEKLVVKPFAKTGRIFQSEAGGILYDPDENCQKAIDKVKADGGTPFHVCVSNMVFGKCYAVLYVGGEREAWATESPTNDGIAAAYVYNADDDECSEYGDIQVCAANGGLVRTA